VSVGKESSAYSVCSGGKVPEHEKGGGNLVKSELITKSNACGKKQKA